MPAISYQVADRTTRGYLAVPPAGAAPGPWRGVVVIHEAFGLNDDIASRWGPRLPSLVNEIASALAGVKS